jgi:hypothetical protein
MMQPALALWASRWRHQMFIIGGATVAALILSGVAVGWALSGRGAAAMEQDAETAAQAANTGAMAELESISAALPAHIAAAVALRDGGFTVAADRVTWVERAVALLRTLGPLGYAVEVSAASPLALPAHLQAGYSDRGVEPPAFAVNDMDLKVQGTHETELLRILEEVRQAGGGVVRVERCRIERRTDGVGIDVECRLRRYSLAVAGKGASS